MTLTKMEIGKKYKGIHTNYIYTCTGCTRQGKPIVEHTHPNGKVYEYIITDASIYEEYKEPRKVERWLWALEYKNDDSIQIGFTTREDMLWAGEVLDKQKITWEEGKGFTLNG